MAKQLCRSDVHSLWISHCKFKEQAWQVDAGVAGWFMTVSLGAMQVELPTQTLVDVSRTIQKKVQVGSLICIFRSGIMLGWLITNQAHVMFVGDSMEHEDSSLQKYKNVPEIALL